MADMYWVGINMNADSYKGGAYEPFICAVYIRNCISLLIWGIEIKLEQ